MGDDFYEDDETLAEIHDAWSRGEPGTTSGAVTLSVSAARIVVDAAQVLDTESHVEIRSEVVDATGWFAPAGRRSRPAPAATSESVTIREPVATSG